ncbi:MAG: hypothetical protein HRT46_11970 [Deltaproteobacteria bacterium]|jgi:hypothetical protein|nr:hypothetical protein [Deltaproteobacteria bacterium]
MSSENRSSKGGMFMTVIMALIIAGIIAYVLFFTDLIIEHNIEDAREADEVYQPE